MKVSGSNQSNVKYANQRLILNELMKNSLARIDLGKKIDLSNPSISKNVEDLIRKQLVVETGTAGSGVGRKSISLCYNSHWGCVAALDFISSAVRIAFSDMSGQILQLKTIENVFIIDNHVIDHVIDETAALYQESFGKLYCICIGTPGEINKETGFFTFAPRFKEAQSINLKQMFEARFDAAIIVKNDVNLAVKGEQMYGKGLGAKNLAFISVDYGVGAGLFLNGRLYEGRRGFAGEIGMLLTDFSRYAEEAYDGEPGGYLDEVVSLFGIKNMVKALIANGEPSIVTNECIDLDEISISKVIDGYLKQDAVCVRAVNRSARYLACMINDLGELLDLEMVIIGGAALSLGDGYLNEVKSFIRDKLKKDIIEIKKSKLKNLATIYGAIGESIEEAITFKLKNDSDNKPE